MQIYPRLDVLFLLPRTRCAETQRGFGAPQADTVELPAFVCWSPLVLQPLKADTSWFLTRQPIGRKGSELRYSVVQTFLHVKPNISTQKTKQATVLTLKMSCYVFYLDFLLQLLTLKI